MDAGGTQDSGNEVGGAVDDLGMVGVGRRCLDEAGEAQGVCNTAKVAEGGLSLSEDTRMAMNFIWSGMGAR